MQKLNFCPVFQLGNDNFGGSKSFMKWSHMQHSFKSDASKIQNEFRFSSLPKPFLHLT